VVTSPLFLVETGALAGLSPGEELVLDGPEGRHAAGVRRIGPGERVDVADGCGVRAGCTVVEAGRGALRLLIAGVRHEPRPQPLLVLVQALAKGDRDQRAVETSTELGVDEVVPWQSGRSVVVWRGDRALAGRRKWQETSRTAAKQARRSWVPTVSPVVTTTELLARVTAAGLAVVLDGDAGPPLAGVRLPANGEVLLIVGPEGGLAPEESQALVEAGGRRHRLGPQVLRSSTAGPAALALLSGAHRWR
jgi:16S rRNA (uracil1498-N3)-methyltransferase